MRDTNSFELRPIEFQVLLALSDGASHGYALIQQIDEMTGGRIALEAPTLYRALRRLSGAGLVRESEPPGDNTDTRRRYYEITPLGLRAVSYELETLRKLVESDAARSLS